MKNKNAQENGFLSHGFSSHRFLPHGFDFDNAKSEENP